jgi:hypothetical protein
MSLNLAPGPLINAAGGVLLLLLAAWVLSVRPRGAASLALGGYCAAFGVWAVAWNLVARDEPGFSEVFFFVVTPAMLLVGAWALRLALVFPRPLAKDERGWLVAAVLVGLASAVPAALLDLQVGPAPVVGRAWGVHEAGLPAFLASTLAARFGFAGLLAAGVLFALRFRRAPEAERGGLLVVSAALLVWPLALAGVLVFMPDGSSTPAYAIFIALVTALAALRLANAASTRSRAAAGLALFLLGTVLMGMVLQTWFGGFRGLFSVGLYGALRTLAAGLLAYAILRHQLLGLDVKVRWTIQKSTIAGAFIGVFFVASEGAQAFFGQGAGNEWLGIAAAGLLVFAMAPLQRAAERVATAAIPVAGGPSPGPSVPPPPRSSREAVYKDAVRLALRDRVLTLEEERALARLGEHLGFATSEALALREAVEAEALRADTASPRAPDDPRPRRRA